MSLRVRGLKAASFAMGIKDDRYYLNGVCFDGDKLVA